MALLVCLASRPGQVVSKETLIAEVWEGAFTSDETLTTAIYELRKALDDSARQPRFVETIRKGGYRLVAEVVPLGDPSSQVPGTYPSQVPGTLESADTSGSTALEVPASEVPGSSGTGQEVPGTSQEGTSQEGTSQEVPGTSDRVPPTETNRTRLAASGIAVGLVLGFWMLRSDPTPSGNMAPTLPIQEGLPTEPPQEDATADLTSLAVLPLTHFGETCGEDAFTGGLTDMLVVDLAAEVPLEVLPSLVTRSHGERWNLQQVTEELDADLVIEGSVVRSAERIWLSVQLVDTSSGKLLWGGSYERSMEDPLLVQRDLASSIAEEVQRIVIEATSSVVPADSAAPPLDGKSSVSLPDR